MPPRVPIEDRKLIVRLSDEGLSQREICLRTGRCRTAVNRIIQAYRHDGRLADAERSGRPRATDDENDMLIAAAYAADPTLTAKEVQESLSLDVSCQTIRRRLQDAGLCNHRARPDHPTPDLTDEERRQRLDFARAVGHWTVDQWREVVFTDESTFCTRWDQKELAWRPFNCRYLLNYTRSLCSSGQCAVSVWGAISKDGLGPLVRIEGSLTTSEYCDILEQSLLPYVLDGPFPDGCYLLQHNRGFVHTSLTVRALLEDRVIPELDWPPSDSDLNPVGNVWAFLRERLAEQDLGNVTADSLWAAISSEWEALRARPETISLLYYSMPRRVAQVIDTGGNFSGY